MVLFVDLEDESEPPEIINTHWQHQHSYERDLRTAHVGALDGAGGDRINPNKNVMTEALGCYPYAHSVPPRPLCHFCVT